MVSNYQRSTHYIFIKGNTSTNPSTGEDEDITSSIQIDKTNSEVEATKKVEGETCNHVITIF